MLFLLKTSRLLFSGVLLAGLASVAMPAAAQQSFSDVPPDHPVYAAAEFLKEAGIISGYDDGTFKPDRKVNRAEALKLIIAPLVPAEQLATVTQTPFADIAAGAWYLPYVEIARQNNIIDGPPSKTNFLGVNNVVKVEFLKMLLLANQIDPNAAFSEIQLPFASDVANPDEWFYPYMRYAISSSIIMIGSDGLLHPGAELTRGDTALFLHRFFMYQQGRRTQALLSEAESEIIIILAMLEGDNIEQAEYASARALIAARGAHLKRPEEAVVRGAVKISEAFRAMVQAYRHGKNGDLEGVVRLAGSSWNLAANAREISGELATISEQVQTITKNMADSARESMGSATQ